MLDLEKRNQEIVRLYKQGFSGPEIFEKENFGITIRQIQRVVKDAGIIRTIGDAFRNAVEKGRVTYHRKPDSEKVKRKTVQAKLRYKILKRDGFRCVKCGADATMSRLQVDHVNENPEDNRNENLQTLCEECNKGKAYLALYN